jgi:hypothetical protein
VKISCSVLVHVRLRPLDESQEQGVVVIDFFTSGFLKFLRTVVES